jgi:N-acetylneuraminic acid mutarotase
VDVDDKFPLEAREGATMNLIGGKLHLLGGVNQRMVPDIQVFNPKNMTWSMLDFEQNQIIFPRFNHSVVSYKKNLYIFGGEKMTNSSFYTRSCLNDVRIFNISKLHTIQT